MVLHASTCLWRALLGLIGSLWVVHAELHQGVMHYLPSAGTWVLFGGEQWWSNDTPSYFSAWPCHGHGSEHSVILFSSVENEEGRWKKRREVSHKWDICHESVWPEVIPSRSIRSIRHVLDLFCKSSDMATSQDLQEFRMGDDFRTAWKFCTSDELWIPTIPVPRFPAEARPPGYAQGVPPSNSSPIEWFRVRSATSHPGCGRTGSGGQHVKRVRVISGPSVQGSLVTME